jgi:hypothetical protein
MGKNVSIQSRIGKSTFQQRQVNYDDGKELLIEIPPKQASQRAAIRVHDECIYASNEGVVQLWMHEVVDGK